MGRPQDWYPLGDGDPTPGDPAEMRALATHLDGVADIITDHNKSLREINTDEGGELWKTDSGAADTFRERQESDLPKRLGLVKARYNKVGQAVRTWADRLEDAQGQADDARLKAKDAQADFDYAEARLKEMGTFVSTPGGPEPEPPTDDPDYQRMIDMQTGANVRIKDALLQVEEAVADRDQYAEKAAEDINAAIHGDELENAWHDTFRQWMGNVGDFFSNASAAAGLLGLIPSPATPFLEAGAFGGSVLASFFHGIDMEYDDFRSDMIGIATFGIGKAITRRQAAVKALKLGRAEDVVDFGAGLSRATSRRAGAMNNLEVRLRRHADFVDRLKGARGKRRISLERQLRRIDEDIVLTRGELASAQAEFKSAEQALEQLNVETTWLDNRLLELGGMDYAVKFNAALLDTGTVGETATELATANKERIENLEKLRERYNR